jgi:hypothetical protein
VVGFGEEECVTMKKGEKLNPPHYRQDPSGVECIQVAEGWGFNLGSVLKYLWRHGRKAGESALDDLQKARWYLDREIARLEREERRVCPVCGGDGVERVADVDGGRTDACPVCEGEGAIEVERGHAESVACMCAECVETRRERAQSVFGRES